MKKVKKKNAIKKSDKTFGKQLLISSIFGCIVGLISFLVLLLIFSAICLSLDSHHAFLLPLSFFAIFSASFFAGFAAVKKNKSTNALLCSTICGIAFALLCTLIMAIVANAFEGLASTSISFLWRALIIPVSIIGGFSAASAPKKKSKRPYKKNHK